MKNLSATIKIAISLSCLLAGCAELAQNGLGKTEYESKCASCHGVTGKGDGPQSLILPKKPANLTMLTKKNDGIFPAAHVHEVIDGRYEVTAHGPRTMPIWGREFELDMPDLPKKDAATFHDRETTVRNKIQALVEYLIYLQDNQ